jgi:hypothetical protein
VNNARIHSLYTALDEAVEILAEIRTSDATCVAAFDTLKQARALVARVFPEQLPTEQRSAQVTSIAA